jgi:endonuclease/exonuclease/phosphatase family metal-dependent hydrolase
MKITSWNIQHGEVYPAGTEVNRAAEIRRTVEAFDCDILLLQEVDHLNERSNFEEQTKEFAEIMQARHWVFAPSVWRKNDGWLDWPQSKGSDFPGFITETITSTQPGYGISIISKIPIVKWERKELSKAFIGWRLPHTSEGVTKKYWVRDHARNALAAYFEDGTVIINSHLSWEPIFRNHQLSQLKRWANQIAKDKSLRVIIAGDFNIRESWEESVNSLRWRTLVKQLTFPVWEPDCQIDHFLARPGIKAKLETTVSSKISDHLPISITLESI